MSTLRQLLVSLPEARIVCGNDDVHVAGLFYDTQDFTNGSALICVPPHKGAETEDFKRSNFAAMASEAIEHGAAVIISEYESVVCNLPASVTGVHVPDARKALALMAAEFYGHPSRKLFLVGITGTNGKTTTAHLIAQVLRSSGLKSVGVIGTLGATTETTTVDTGHTTPKSLDTQRILSQFLASGVEAVVMEVSSHGLALQRVSGCAFDVAIFTNFSQDHLNFHKSMEGYWAAKVLFFTDVAKYSLQYKPGFTAIINIDDEYGQRLLHDVVRDSGYKYKTYSIESKSDVRALNVRITPSNVEFLISPPQEEQTQFDIPLTGRFNIYNSLAAISFGLHRNIPISKIQQSLASVSRPGGRMEFIDEGQPFSVVVDYAHSPGALDHVLSALRESTSGKLICVFGCGGNRDESKRPQMGAVAAELADVIIITSDNPRDEDPSQIIEDVMVGTKISDETRRATSVTTMVDRKAAIECAVWLAKEGDCVLIAGKGHEDYQILKEETVHFDDREVVRELLTARVKLNGMEVNGNV